MYSMVLSDGSELCKYSLVLSEGAEELCMFSTLLLEGAELGITSGLTCGVKVFPATGSSAEELLALDASDEASTGNKTVLLVEELTCDASPEARELRDDVGEG